MGDRELRHIRVRRVALERSVPPYDNGTRRAGRGDGLPLHLTQMVRDLDEIDGEGCVEAGKDGRRAQHIGD